MPSGGIPVQPDQKILVSGFIPFDKDPLKTLVRLLPDGSPDPTFTIGARFRGSVSTVVLQPDGKILVEGPFSHFNDVPAQRIVWLNADGTFDATFSPADTDIAVEQIVLQPNGKIIIQGTYNSIIINPNSSYVASKIARLHPNGSVDETFKPILGPHDYIEHIIVQPEGRLLLAGNLHLAGKNVLLLNADGSVNQFFYTLFFEQASNVKQVLIVGKDLFAVAYSKLFKLNRDASQRIAFDSIPDKAITDGPFALSAQASSGLPVTFTIVSGPASVKADTVTLTGVPGTVTIRASQVGNDMVNAAPDVERTFRVGAVMGLETVTDLVRVFPSPASGLFAVDVPAFWRISDIRLLSMSGKPV